MRAIRAAASQSRPSPRITGRGWASRSPSLARVLATARRKLAEFAERRLGQRSSRMRAWASWIMATTAFRCPTKAARRRPCLTVCWLPGLAPGGGLLTASAAVISHQPARPPGSPCRWPARHGCAARHPLLRLADPASLQRLVQRRRRMAQRHRLRRIGNIGYSVDAQASAIVFHRQRTEGIKTASDQGLASVARGDFPEQGDGFTDRLGVRAVWSSEGFRSRARSER